MLLSGSKYYSWSTGVDSRCPVRLSLPYAASCTQRRVRNTPCSRPPGIHVAALLEFEFTECKSPRLTGKGAALFMCKSRDTHLSRRLPVNLWQVLMPLGLIQAGTGRILLVQHGASRSLVAPLCNISDAGG